MTDSLLYLIAIVLLVSNCLSFCLGYLYAKIGRLWRKKQHPDCCCEYNPDKPSDTRLISNCCVVHNPNPDPCFADEKCACAEEHYNEDQE